MVNGLDPPKEAGHSPVHPHSPSIPPLLREELGHAGKIQTFMDEERKAVCSVPMSGFVDGPPSASFVRRFAGLSGLAQVAQGGQVTPAGSQSHGRTGIGVNLREIHLQVPSQTAG